MQNRPLPKCHYYGLFFDNNSNLNLPTWPRSHFRQITDDFLQDFFRLFSLGCSRALYLHHPISTTKSLLIQ
jgi:hypothetical protein